MRVPIYGQAEVDIAVAQAKRAARQLMETGTQPASIKLATWGAALSVQQSLQSNCRMVRRLVDSGYVWQALPREYEDMKLVLAGLGMLYSSHHTALLRAEELADSGALNFLLDMPLTLDAQRAKREQAYKLLSGYGYSWKAISMIFLILDCENSQLIPIDRHHLARLAVQDSNGKALDRAPTSKASYELLETAIHTERLQYGYASLNGLIWAWALWELWRKQIRKSRASAQEAESHIGLSCRDYPPLLAID